MIVLIFGLGLFIIAFIIHVALWRVRKPANSIKAIIAIFTITLVTGSMILPIPNLATHIHIWLLYFSLFTAYLLAYPAIEVDSPSLVLVLQIYHAKTKGLKASDLSELAKDNLLVEPRLKDLVDAGLVDISSSVYKINNKGKMFILPFIFYRNIVGLGKGG